MTQDREVSSFAQKKEGRIGINGRIEGNGC